MYEHSDNKARQKKVKRSEKHNAQKERNTSTELKMHFFLCQRRNIGFCASLAVCLWEGREGHDCREVDWAKGSQLVVW